MWHMSERIRSLSFQPPHDHLARLPDGRPARRLNLNESPLPPAPSVIAAMADAVTEAHRYPDARAAALTTALAGRSSIPIERVVVGAGSNELLAASAELSLEPGDEMVAPVPAFPTYAKLAALRGARFRGVPITSNGRIDLDAMLAAVSENTRLMFVSSPHNPTGALMDEAEIVRLASELPDHVMLHFDEAYYEFGRAAGGPETLPLLARRKGPWLATRTFSKAHALAGARVGYGFAGSAEIALSVRKIRPNFSLNRIALAGALAALEAEAYSRDLIARLLHERDRIVAALEPHGFQALKGSANFVALVPPELDIDFVAALAKEGIFITSFDFAGRTALRITIGIAEDSDAIIANLRNLAGN
jgi:histidinol-phosphate aminotransferase